MFRSQLSTSLRVQSDESHRMRNVGLLAAPLAALALSAVATRMKRERPRVHRHPPQPRPPLRRRPRPVLPHLRRPIPTTPKPQPRRHPIRRLRDRGTERHPRRVEWRRRFCGASGGLHQHGQPHVHARRFPGVSYVTGASGSEVGAAAAAPDPVHSSPLPLALPPTSLVRATNVENYRQISAG